MKRLIGYTAAICLLALMVGCGGVTSTGTLAYVSNSTGTGFTVFSVNTDGTLTKASISPQSTPAPPKVLRFSANGKWAYYLDNAGATLYGYTRAGNGDLATQFISYPISGFASALVLSPNNQFLYIALRDTQYIDVLALNSATGVPTFQSHNHVGYSITQLLLAPSGNVLYAVSPTQQAVLSFTLDSSSGKPTLVTPTQSVGVKPQYLVLSANGSYLYVLDGQSTLPISVDSGAACGQTTPTVLFSPNIFGFNTSAGGALTQMANSPFNPNPIGFLAANEPATDLGCYPSNPIAGVTSNDTRYLFVANQGTHNISTFKISTGSSNGGAGELSEVLNSQVTINGVTVTTGSPFDCGSGCLTPSFIAVSTANNGLYVVDPGTQAAPAGKIFQYQINQSNGTLRQQNPTFVGAEGTPTWITIR